MTRRETPMEEGLRLEDEAVAAFHAKHDALAKIAAARRRKMAEGSGQPPGADDPRDVAVVTAPVGPAFGDEPPVPAGWTVRDEVSRPTFPDTPAPAPAPIAALVSVVTAPVGPACTIHVGPSATFPKGYIVHGYRVPDDYAGSDHVFRGRCVTVHKREVKSKEPGIETEYRYTLRSAEPPPLFPPIPCKRPVWP